MTSSNLANALVHWWRRRLNQDDLAFLADRAACEHWVKFELALAAAGRRGGRRFARKVRIERCGDVRGGPKDLSLDAKLVELKHVPNNKNMLGLVARMQNDLERVRETHGAVVAVFAFHRRTQMEDPGYYGWTSGDLDLQPAEDRAGERAVPFRPFAIDLARKFIHKVCGRHAEPMECTRLTKPEQERFWLGAWIGT